MKTGNNHALGIPMHEEITEEFFRRLKMPIKYFKKFMRREQYKLITDADHVDYNKENTSNTKNWRDQVVKKIKELR
ncbi:MAG: hypothetical protein ACOCRX_04455 [Candidatus Woesearchaeota archaeon]